MNVYGADTINFETKGLLPDATPRMAARRPALASPGPVRPASTVWSGTSYSQIACPAARHPFRDCCVLNPCLHRVEFGAGKKAGAWGLGRPDYVDI